MARRRGELIEDRNDTDSVADSSAAETGPLLSMKQSGAVHDVPERGSGLDFGDAGKPAPEARAQPIESFRRIVTDVAQAVDSGTAPAPTGVVNDSPPKRSFAAANHPPVETVPSTPLAEIRRAAVEEHGGATAATVVAQPGPSISWGRLLLAIAVLVVAALVIRAIVRGGASHD